MFKRILALAAAASAVTVNVQDAGATNLQAVLLKYDETSKMYYAQNETAKFKELYAANNNKGFAVKTFDAYGNRCDRLVLFYDADNMSRVRTAIRENGVALKVSESDGRLLYDSFWDQACLREAQRATSYSDEMIDAIAKRLNAEANNRKAAEGKTLLTCPEA